MYTPKLEIRKFVLDEFPTEQRYTWPHIVGVLGVQIHEAQAVLWAIVYPESPERPYKILCFRTGEEVYGNTTYLGTVRLANGEMAHYFAGGPGL